MNKAEKLLGKVRKNPRNVSFAELEQLLLAHGFEFRRSRGSHHIYTHGQRADIRITVPFKRPHVGEVYVKQVIDLIEQLSLR